MIDQTMLLERYSKAKAAIEEHIEQHKDIFDAHQFLVLSLIDAENDLRDAVAESGKGVTNGEYNVTVTPQESEVCDFQKLDELIAAGVVSNETRMQIVKKQVRPARITISKI